MDDEEPVFPAFPYKPYHIQLDFMKALYRSLENGGIAMLESPTGNQIPIRFCYLFIECCFNFWFFIRDCIQLKCVCMMQELGKR